MKVYRNAVILVIILGLLVGAYVFFKNKTGGDTSSDTGTGNDIIRIFDLDTTKMKELTLENSDGKFVFDQVMEKQDDTDVRVWKISSPANLKIDTSKVNSIAINFSSLTADKLIEENATDLSKYGLDKPVIVTIKMEDDTEKALEIGDETPTKGGYYAMEKGSGTVYTIDSYSGGKIKVSKNDIRDTDLFSCAKEDITGLAMERNGEKVFSSEKADETVWSLTYPIEGNVNSSSADPIFTSITDSTIKSFVEENPADLGKYGLGSPKYVIEFDTASGKSRLLLGNEKVNGSEIYAMVEGSNEVITLDESLFTYLDKPFKEIVESFVYIVNINEVTNISLMMDGKTVNCELQTDKDDSDNDKFFVDGKEVTALKDDSDSQLFRKLYQAMVGITLDDIELGANPTGTPDISITYTLSSDPGTMKVDLIPKDENYYYAMRNGTYTGILVKRNKQDFGPEGLKAAYNTLKEAMDKSN